jgi:hypothetical protein
MIILFFIPFDSTGKPDAYSGRELYVKNDSQTSGPVPISGLLCGFRVFRAEIMKIAKLTEESEIDPWTLFLNTPYDKR